MKQILSPSRNPRNHAIDTITIHCMAGKMTAEQCAQWLARPETKASANYCVGYDGSVCISVPENERSWASSNRDNDMRAVTIEVSNDGGAPDWHVPDKALEALINLLVDVCKRNEIKELKWQNHPSSVGKPELQNMTVHRWFAKKACPGNYLMSKMPYIAKEVNERMKENISKEMQICIDKGIIKGFSDGTYRPQETLTRNQMCGILCRAFGWK